MLRKGTCIEEKHTLKLCVPITSVMYICPFLGLAVLETRSLINLKKVMFLLRDSTAQPLFSYAFNSFDKIYNINFIDHVGPSIHDTMIPFHIPKHTLYKWIMKKKLQLNKSGYTKMCICPWNCQHKGARLFGAYTSLQTSYIYINIIFVTWHLHSNCKL